MEQRTKFTPALGLASLTPLYDRVISLLTREQVWREELLRSLDPCASETIVDLGSGTGSLAILIKQAAPNTIVTALDPDPKIRVIAEEKALVARVEISFLTARGEEDNVELLPESIDKVAISLVLHQCTTIAKAGILKTAFRVLKPGAAMYIADYGAQQGLLMKLLFNQVRLVDGFENTRANKSGCIPSFLRAAGFEDVREPSFTRTPTGSISLYTCRKPVR